MARESESFYLHRHSSLEDRDNLWDIITIDFCVCTCDQSGKGLKTGFVTVYWISGKFKGLISVLALISQL